MARFVESTMNDELHPAGQGFVDNTAVAPLDLCRQHGLYEFLRITLQ